MSFDHRTIMQEAWAIVRRFQGKRDPRTVQQLLGHALRLAWHDAKMKRQITLRSRAMLAAKAELEVRSVESLEAEAITLENRTFLGQEGMDRLRAVQTALRVARAREAQSLPIAA